MTDGLERDDYPDDYRSPVLFNTHYPEAHASLDALRWELRHRHANGLIEDGVVLERYSHPDASRPSLLISPSRYFARLRRSTRGSLS